MEERTATLTKNQAFELAKMIDKTIVDYVESYIVDDIEQLADIIHGYEKLREISGYVSRRESRKE